MSLPLSCVCFTEKCIPLNSSLHKNLPFIQLNYSINGSLLKIAFFIYTVEHIWYPINHFTQNTTVSCDSGHYDEDIIFHVGCGRISCMCHSKHIGAVVALVKWCHFILMSISILKHNNRKSHQQALNI